MGKGVTPPLRLDLPKDREFEAGIWYTTPCSTWYPAHYHDELELNLVIRGHAVIRVADQELTLRAGALLWLAPGQSHAMVGISPDYAMWVVSLRPDAVREVEKSSGARLSDRARSWGECRVSAERFRALGSLLSSSPSHGRAAEQNGLSRRILASAIETWRAHERLRSTSNADYRAASHGPHEAIVRAEALLRATDAKVPLAALARSCGVSESRLSHIFKAQLGLSVVQFQNHFRVQDVIAKLGRGDSHTMLAAALDAGFGSYAQFHRAFRQVVGYGPAEHLHRVKAGIVRPVSLAECCGQGGR